MGINTKSQKEIETKEQLARELRSCMKCRFFWGNDNRCINNEKCGSKNNAKHHADTSKENKCVGCPYGKNSTYCFPCMKDLLASKERRIHR